MNKQARVGSAHTRQLLVAWRAVVPAHQQCQPSPAGPPPHPLRQGGTHLVGALELLHGLRELKHLGLERRGGERARLELIGEELVDVAQVQLLRLQVLRQLDVVDLQLVPMLLVPAVRRVRHGQHDGLGCAHTRLQAGLQGATTTAEAVGKHARRVCCCSLVLLPHSSMLYRRDYSPAELALEVADDELLLHELPLGPIVGLRCLLLRVVLLLGRHRKKSPRYGTARRSPPSTRGEDGRTARVAGAACRRVGACRCRLLAALCLHHGKGLRVQSSAGAAVLWSLMAPLLSPPWIPGLPMAVALTGQRSHGVARRGAPHVLSHSKAHTKTHAPNRSTSSKSPGTSDANNG